MSISSLYLDAFLEVAKQKKFSIAAKKLHITQSALSQRVLNLEEELGVTLFVRKPLDLQITEVGQKLLRYCQAKDTLEEEFVKNIKPITGASLTGTIRISGFSSVNQSIVIPILSKVINANSSVQLELCNKEMREQKDMLGHGEVDFIISSQQLTKHGIKIHLLGYEQYVLVQPNQAQSKLKVILDHDVDDSTSIEFFKRQKQSMPEFTRSYLDEIYSIMAGVRCGLGWAVVPMHIVRTFTGIKKVPGYAALKMPVYLMYYEKTFYTKLEKVVIDLLLREFPGYLK